MTLGGKQVIFIKFKRNFRERILKYYFDDVPVFIKDKAIPNDCKIDGNYGFIDGVEMSPFEFKVKFHKQFC